VILTMLIVMAFILPLTYLATRRTISPGPAPERRRMGLRVRLGLRRGIAVRKPGATTGLRGFFIFIFFSNWSGLVPPIGKIEQLRAPTSDVNVTIGLALTSFVIFQSEGFRRLGVRAYLGKFFPIGEFRHGLGAGLLAMYVGIIELFLEFVKPVTLSMRLFGNIYGARCPGRHHRADSGGRPGGARRPRGAAEPDPGPHLLGPDPHVHPDRYRGHGEEEHKPARAGATTHHRSALGGAD